MINIRNFALGLALALIGTDVHAQAQPGNDTVAITRVEPAPQDAGAARRSALARELIELSTGPNFLKEFERAMGDQLSKIDEKGGQEAVWVRANMPPMLSRMIVRLMDEMVPAYAELYTEEELQAQIDFYRSPIGRSVAAKAIPLGVAVQEVQTKILMSFLTEFEGKYCAQFDCGAAEQASAKPSRR